MGETESSSVDSKPADGADSPWRFFLCENNEGKGWLIERPWLDVRVGFELFEAPWLECDGGGKLGMPYAFSRMSASEILGRGLAGEADVPLAEFDAASLCVLGESNLLDQGGIAKLWIVSRSIQVAHRV